MSISPEQMFNPEKHGLVECPHCNGYGSSLKDPEGVDKCTRCGGSGLIKGASKGTTHIKVHVYDDGDIELTNIEATPGHVFTTSDLIFAPTEVSKGCLKKELISYGAEESDVVQAIDYVLASDVGTSVIIGEL